MMDTMSGNETSQMGGTLATALFLVFFVMALQFNSPKLSLMVMLCIPFSLAGSFGFMFLTTGVISLLDLFGFLVLFGIVVNNGILLIDATNELRKSMPLGEALVQAGEMRLRPILMTTLTTVISMIPLILSTDGGIASVKGMGYVVIGGLVASTILTMFLMPPFYLLMRGENVDGSKRQARQCA
jgi:multidrug efflux pump subunit AcrB